MPFTLTQVDPNTVKLEFEIPAEEIDSAFNRELRRQRGQVRVRGFRPGKVPLSLLRSYVGREVMAEVLGGLMERALLGAVEEKELLVAGPPDLERTPHQPGESFRFSVTMEVHERPRDIDLDGLQVFRRPTAISEEEVDRQIERLRDLNARNVAIDPPRPAAKGDVARLDYRLTFDDKPDAEPLVREGVEIELGAGYVLDEIADGVIGMSPGDEREVALSFPADHHLTAFAGRSAKAKLRLADLYDRKLPEMGDEFAKDLGEADLVSLRSSVRREMEAEADRSAESAANRGLLDRLVKRAGVSLPKQWLEKQFREKLESFRRTFGGGREVGEQEQGMLRREVDRQMRRAVVVAWLSRAHRLDATPEQVEAEMAAVAERLGRPLPAVKAEFAKRGTASLEADLTERNVLRFLREKAEVVDGEPPEEEGEEEIPGD